MKVIHILIYLILVLFLFGCASGVQYNKVYLNDEDMTLGAKSIQSTEITSTTYREGASGADGGSTGGGCGCN